MEEIKRIAQTLTKGFGSHDYLISRSEARELLGSQVVLGSKELEDLLWELYQDFSKDMELNIPFEPTILMNSRKGSQQSVDILLKKAMIESSKASDVAETEIKLVSISVPTSTSGLISQKIVQEITKNGWKHYA